MAIPAVPCWFCLAFARTTADKPAKNDASCSSGRNSLSNPPIRRSKKSNPHSAARNPSAWGSAVRPRLSEMSARLRAKFLTKGTTNIFPASAQLSEYKSSKTAQQSRWQAVKIGEHHPVGRLGVDEGLWTKPEDSPPPTCSLSVRGPSPLFHLSPHPP